MNIVSIKITNAIANVPIHCHSKKVRYKMDCYTMHFY